LRCDYNHPDIYNDNNYIDVSIGEPIYNTINSHRQDYKKFYVYV